MKYLIKKPYFQYHKMQYHTRCNRNYQIHVLIQRHRQQTFIFTQRIHRIKHFNHN